MERFCVFFATFALILHLVQSQDQSEFISLSCGLVPKDTTYTEKTTSIIYKSDANYINSGLIGRISNEYTSNIQQQTWTLRKFPKGDRNCYNFNLTAKSRYLIRGTFLYGNYDGMNKLPEFDLYIGPNKWTSVSFIGIANASAYEMIHVLTQDRLQVCLFKTGESIPFINSLELRPLKNDTYVTQTGSLISFLRVHFSPTPPFVRYGYDIHDRSWVSYDLMDSYPYFLRTLLPQFIDETVPISTNLSVDNNSRSFDVPQIVAKSAAVPANTSQPLTLNWSFNESNAQCYIYMHFAEIQNLEANETREFNITDNGRSFFLPNYKPKKLMLETVGIKRAMSSPDGNFSFSLAMTSDSTLPPLLNAIEIYTVLEMLQLETDQDEVSAMLNIKTTYGLSGKVSWEGDPCAPQSYRWEGLNCSYPDSDPPRITSLNLKDSKLTGNITSEISNLTQLIELDLSKNDLSGEIPAFFADMKSLKLLNLRGNPKLNTTVPDSLQERIKSKSLTLILSDKKFPVVAIATSVAGVFVLLVIVAIYFIVRWKMQKTPGLSIITKDRRITYSEVLKMTNNLEKILGKGGFGTVYYGNLDNTQVAVKMLSHTSSQGYKEFKAEVELLLRVHHKNLVGLVGFCDDGDNLALIYEYMANGDLKENMSGKRGGHILTWENRMQIAVEAAQGLEYLHNGCTPPMVHRDVKTTNILLNEKFGAKIADFGLSRSFPINGENHVSTVVAGTPGYLDPEYYRTNWLSEKSDVYSFGVVLLEIVTNQPVISQTREKSLISEWVGFMLTKGDINSIVDPKLMGDFDTNSAWKVVELALACVKPSSDQRPTMTLVTMELNDCLALEKARRQGSQEMNSEGIVQLSLSYSTELAPRPK